MLFLGFGVLIIYDTLGVAECLNRREEIKDERNKDDFRSDYDNKSCLLPEKHNIYICICIFCDGDESELVDVIELIG